MVSFILTLFCLAVVLLQFLIGGVRPVYSLPAYLLLGVAAVFALWPLRQRDLVRPRYFCVPAALLVALYFSARAALSPIWFLARNDFLLILGALLVYLLTALVLTRTSRRLVICWGLLILAALHVAVGAVQFRQGTNFMLLGWIYRSDYGCRASGFYICPNHLAGVLEILAVMAMTICCWARGGWWFRVAAVYGVVICLLGLALTGSRGGFVSELAGCLVVASLSAWVLKRLKLVEELPKSVFFFSLAVVILLGGVCLLMLKSDALATRVGSVYDPENMRLQMWSAALQQFQLNPLFGTGAGTYYFYGRQFREAIMQNDPLHVHNDYLETLSEYGIAGLLLMLGFIALHLYSGWRGLVRIVHHKLKPTKSAQSTALALLIGAIAGTVALLVHSAVDFNLHIPANAVLLAFVFGILAHPANVETLTQRRERAPGWLQALVPGLGLTLAVWACSLLPGEFIGERARVALRDQDYPAAVTFAEAALARQPRHPDFYYYLGESQHYLALAATDPAETDRLHRAAAAAFTQGLQIFPQDVRLLLKLGRTLDSLGEYAAAEAIFQQAFAADPKSANVHAYYALHCHLAGQRDLAEKFYHAAAGLGEKDISVVGLEDLRRDRQVRRANVLSVMSEFVTPSDEEPLPSPESQVVSKP